MMKEKAFNVGFIHKNTCHLYPFSVPRTLSRSRPPFCARKQFPTIASEMALCVPFLPKEG